MPSQLKRTFWSLLRLSLGLAVLGVLIWWGRIDVTVLFGTFDEPALLAAAAALIFISIPISSLRWWLLLRGLNFDMSLGWCLRTTFTSLFCNTFLPGAYGGDLVRIGLTYRIAGRSLSRIVFTVLLDRFAGLLGLATIGLIAIPQLRSDRTGQSEIWLILFMVTAFAMLLLAALTGDKIIAFLSRLPFSPARRLSSIIHEMLQALRAYMGRRKLLAGVFALSVIIFAVTLWAIALLGSAMHFNALRYSGYFTAGVWGLLANALPITPGGIGVGEVVFEQSCHLLETVRTNTSYATVFLAMRALSILASLPGLFLFAVKRHELALSGSEGPG